MLALKGSLQFSSTRAQDPTSGTITLPAGTKETANQILQSCRLQNRHPRLDEALKLCDLYQLPVPPWALVQSASEAHQEADELGFPLALKVVSGEISHKTDSGGLILNLRNHNELETAFESLAERLKASIDGFLLQKMVETGREVILGGKNDPAFGPILLLGLGGIYVEVLQDSAIRLAPVSREDAFQMMHELKGFKLLKGVRGQPGVDVNLLADSLVKLSHLINDFPEIQELDINPLILYPEGGFVVDARIFIHTGAPKADRPQEG